MSNCGANVATGDIGHSGQLCTLPALAGRPALRREVRLVVRLFLFVWSTVFTVYFFSISTMLWGWVGLVIGHLGVIFAMYFTFKQFHNIPYVKKPDPNDPPLYDDVWYGS